MIASLRPRLRTRSDLGQIVALGHGEPTLGYPQPRPAGRRVLTELDLDRAYSELRERSLSARWVVALWRSKRCWGGPAGGVGLTWSNSARPPKASAARAKRFSTWMLEQRRFLGAAAGDRIGLVAYGWLHRAAAREAARWLGCEVPHNPADRGGDALRGRALLTTGLQATSAACR